jgi:hypothetical protein
MPKCRHYKVGGLCHKSLEWSELEMESSEYEFYCIVLYVKRLLYNFGTEGIISFNS